MEQPHPASPQGEECLTGTSYEEVSLIQRGRLFDAKKGSLQYEETPSSNREEASAPTSLRMERGVDSIVSHRTNNSSTCQPVVIIILNFEL